MVTPALAVTITRWLDSQGRKPSSASLLSYIMQPPKQGWHKNKQANSKRSEVVAHIGNPVPECRQYQYLSSSSGGQHAPRSLSPQGRPYQILSLPRLTPIEQRQSFYESINRPVVI